MRNFAKRQSGAEPTEPARAPLLTLNELDHPHEPAVTAEPAPVVGVMSLLKAIAPTDLPSPADTRLSQHTKVFGAHLGRHHHVLLHSAMLAMQEARHSIRQVRDDALGAAAKAHRENDVDGVVAANADVDALNTLIDRLA
jgi:hypothetical protein